MASVRPAMSMRRCAPNGCVTALPRDVRAQPVPEDDPLFLVEHIQDLLEEGKSGRPVHQAIRPHAPERFSAEDPAAVELEDAVQPRIGDEDVTARRIDRPPPVHGRSGRV